VAADLRFRPRGHWNRHDLLVTSVVSMKLGKLPSIYGFG